MHTDKETVAIINRSTSICIGLRTYTKLNFSGVEADSYTSVWKLNLSGGKQICKYNLSISGKILKNVKCHAK
jgi:hypothetical protein